MIGAMSSHGLSNGEFNGHLKRRLGFGIGLHPGAFQTTRKRGAPAGVYFNGLV
jgi:hypothetical protein